MSAASLVTLPAQSEAQFRRLVAAELLKLRRRRTLLVASVALIVAPMVVSFIVLASLHAANPAKYANSTANGLNVKQAATDDHTERSQSCNGKLVR